MQFKQFRDAVNNKFTELSNNTLYVVNVSKEQLWETYQSAFTAEQNPIFRERKVHECNTCYSFIKRLGAVVSINENNSLDTIWNISNCPTEYANVAQSLHALVSSAAISGVFLTDERLAGKEYNIEANVAGDIKWEHFYADISKFYTSRIGTDLGEINSTVTVFKRALDEISIGTLDTVIDLCDSIYRGAEFKPTVSKFAEAKRKYINNPHPNFVWVNYNKYPAKIRNSAIGTLLIDIENGVELDEAVRKYEAVVAPQNYKRTTAIATEGMKQQALKTINELGIEPSLPRRHASLEDISINNVLFADRSAKSIMKGIDALLQTNSVAQPPKGATELTIEQFITSVLPTAQKIELLVENRLTPNFVSLVAPINPDAPSILKWNNNFSWSYNGEVTDSMKERVKSAGGKVDGVLRFSIQWNENNDNQCDLDAWCKEPNGNRIGFFCKTGHASTGMLDVDIQVPGSKVAVENITWSSKSLMQKGTYTFWVNNFNTRNPNKSGFTAQIEFDGQIFDFTYAQPLNSDQNVVVAEVEFDGTNFKLIPKLPSSASQKTEWDITTLQYQRVSTIMLSPNFWDEQSIGNKHYFFMLDGCKNPSDVRGFYNEFLSNELTPHRKVFEMLSSVMKCEYSSNQLSGLGFSSTVPNSVHCKVDGRPYTIKF